MMFPYLATIPHTRSMPTQSFIATFFPVAELTEDRSHYLPSRNAFRAVPAAAKSPQEIYEPLIAALNDRKQQKARCPGFVFEDVAARSVHPRRIGYMKPHVCCFSTSSIDLLQSCELSSRSELGHAELFFEVKPDPSHDDFTDAIPIAGSDTVYESFASNRAPAGVPAVVLELHKARGQHIAYVVEVFARQFREFFFSISMAGSCARLLRWDRSACIVSESFDIRKHPEILCEFLWRFGQASAAGRGHDVTVEPALTEEEAIFETLVTEATALQLGVSGQALRQAVLQHYQPGKVMAIQVLDHGEPSNIWRRLLVSRPVISPLSLCGRGTRGFWAVDTSSHRVVFLKDTWRTTAISDLEGEILRHMAEDGVRNIPHVVAHGDVPRHLPNDGRKLSTGDYQSTITDEYKSQPWVHLAGSKDIHISPRRHYRLVLEQVGYEVRFLRGTEELLNASYDVFAAMRDALEKDSRVHRDISPGNIILVRDREDQTIRKGYLIDWESSCTVDESGLAAKAGRAGTWLFMSRELCLDHENIYRQTIKDDMESLLYVVLYCALHWLPHNYGKDTLADCIAAFFKHRDAFRNSSVGGAGKLANAQDRHYTRSLTFGDSALKEWLDTVMNYIAPASREQYELYKDKWSSEQLDAFWSDFLKTHKLQANDRFNHDLPRLSLPLEAPTPPTPSKRPSSPSPVPDVRPVHAARGPSNKRPRQGSPTPSDTDTKRAHITRITRSQAGPSEGPRRSKRIREHEERVAVAQMPAPVAVPRGRGRRGAAAKHQASTSRSSGRGGAAGTPSRGGARTRGGSRSRSRSDRDARTTTSRK